MFRGKKTFFYNGEKRLPDRTKRRTGKWRGRNENLLQGSPMDCEIIIVLPGVNVISERVFYQCHHVKTVIIPDTVKRIESSAFEDCKSLLFVKLSKNLEYIGIKAFYGCKSLTSIFIPESCREIGKSALEDCKELMNFNVHQYTTLGENVIYVTKLVNASPCSPYLRSDYDDSAVNTWIKDRHNDLPLLRLCCSEDPTFNQSTIIPTKKECLKKDDCELTPFMYLMYNTTAEYDAIEQIVKIGEKDSLFIEYGDGWNALHWACDLGYEAVTRLLKKKVEKNWLRH